MKVELDRRQCRKAPRAPRSARPRRTSRVCSNGSFSTKLDKSTRRVKLIAFVFVLVYAAIAARLVYFGTAAAAAAKQWRRKLSDTVAAARPDIFDRNGEILATDIKVTSVFADPRRIIDKDDAVDQLTSVLPDVDAKKLREKLGSRKGFVWVKRAVTPTQQQAIYHLGLPGVGFMQENKRVYPDGPIAAHVLGYANINGIGISGLEEIYRQPGLGRFACGRVQADPR